MSESPGLVDSFEWDPTRFIEPTAQSMFRHIPPDEPTWEQIPEHVREGWRDLATAVLMDVLPGLANDAVLAFAKFEGRHIEVLETRAELETKDD